MHMINVRQFVHRFLRLSLCTSCAIALTACQPFNYEEADAPVPLQSVPKMEPKPKIALVLGAGGPRGYAHIGVMRVLEDACIDIDLIVGSSVGSVLGVFWASGLDAREIDKRSNEGGPLTLFDPNPFADRGWIRGRKLQDYVNTQLDNQRLEDMPRRVIVVATQRDNKSPSFFTSGNSGVAVRASSAVPGIISPVGINGVEFEDGDVSLPLAVSAARDAGAEFVIAVNVYPKLGSIPENASEKDRAQVIRRSQQIEAEIKNADFLIHAETPFKASPRKAFFKASRLMGEQEAIKRLPALIEALKQQQISVGENGC